MRAGDPSIRVILLDIEGTTTPIDFVTKTLFPYASGKLESFLREHSAEPEIQTLVAELREQQQRDQAQGLRPPPWNDGTGDPRLRSVVAYGQWLIQKDSKCTPLKTLQGKIWQEGYAKGELHGEVYADVAPGFTRWHAQGRKIYIYSSGSELAQRLLFSTVSSGDLTRYISGFFDTRLGAKGDSQSYKKIAGAVVCRPEEILFISDALKEVEAAERAGMKAILCMREGSSAAAPQIPVIHSFDDVFLD